MVAVTRASRHKRRARRALGEPPASLSDFPHLTNKPPAWFRAHTQRTGRDGGCWWFSSHAEGASPDGRFDLVTPDGTCYLANSRHAAALEKVGRYLARHTWVPASAVDGVVVTRVDTLHTGSRLIADWTSPSAPVVGATRELSTTPDYRLSSRWAQAFFRDGFAALVYQPRFSTGDELAIALFGPEGRREWAVRSGTPLRKVLVGMGVKVAATPYTVETDDAAQAGTQ